MADPTPTDRTVEEAAAQAAVPFDGTEPAPDVVSGSDVADVAARDGAAPDDAAAAAEDAGDGAAADETATALAAAERARDEYLDALRRERAEFENYRRRALRERTEAADRGAEQVVSGLLAVLDNFGFALDAAEDRAEEDRLAKGVRMVHAELVSVLRGAGLQDVPGAGAVFDPTHHEAVASVDSDDPVDEPVVVEVLRPGYRFKGRVLRPASVKVAR